MKTKLLKALRTKGRNQININSVKTTNGTVTGMTIGYNDDIYKGLFSFGDTKEQVFKKAENIYIKANIERLRIKYKKIPPCKP